MARMGVDGGRERRRDRESSPTRHEDRARARDRRGEGSLSPANGGTTLYSVEGGQPRLNVRRSRRNDSPTCCDPVDL